MDDEKGNASDTAALPLDPWVTSRRSALARSASAERIPKEDVLPPSALGLALSGGGIRSATISLGLAQAFSRRDRLLDFDYMSTVSGGGYFGAFLASLFMPMNLRGVARAGRQLSPDSWRQDPKRRRMFVEFVLGCDANEDTIPWPAPDEGSSGLADAGPAKPVQIRNPIWWLREHGRYLAPNGPTDYMYAAAFVSRNWLAMLYTFVIAATTAFFALTFAAYWATYSIGRINCNVWSYLHLPFGASPEQVKYDLSPLLAIPGLAALLALASGMGYWVTVSLDTNSRWSNRRWKYLSPLARFAWQSVLGLAMVAAAAALVWYFLQPFSSHPAAWIAVALGGALGIIGIVIAVSIAIYTRDSISNGESFTAELRRRLTKSYAIAINILLWSLALGLIDTFALAERAFLTADNQPHRTAITLLPFTVGPPAAWLSSKVVPWLSGGRLAKFVGDYIWTIALIVGVALFGLVAVVADTLVQILVWPASRAWFHHGIGPVALPFALISLMLFVVTGWSSGFINLSSLQGFYTGRLTRAYLGASNLERLLADVPAGTPERAGKRRPLDQSPITENHEKDYIDASIYCQRDPDNFGPIHLINATLNETRSRDHSQLTDRDRKGVPIVFAPEGVLVNAARSSMQNTAKLSWKYVRENDVDSLDVGQLTAISGAAASSGMGSRTTLGGALLLTFANVRLGYWWVVNKAIVRKIDVASAWIGFRKGPLATFYYFFNEMTARYSLADDRVYLSDGGHFENSGAYELLRRRVKLIVVCDSGADADYQFEDLENLVRKARIDLGLAIDVVPAKGVAAIYGAGGEKLFLNYGGADWRQTAKNTDTGFALCLNVFESNGVVPSPDEPEPEPVSRIVWLKPKVATGLPQDVLGYAARNPDFPQQSTADQFFDEAQWESYRALGYVIGERLLTETAHKADTLRRAIPGALPIRAETR